MGLRRITLDFDGSMQSTRRHAEGTAVGYNKIKKGARSYYNLYCTLAQTGQVFDLLARSGNVHDSRGALEFIIECVSQIQQALLRGYTGLWTPIGSTLSARATSAGIVASASSAMQTSARSIGRAEGNEPLGGTS
jgi:hypothetical protein